MLRLLSGVVAFFCAGFFFFFPFFAFAFEVSPSVIDVSFGEGISEVTQVFSIVNTLDEVRLFEARVQQVTFASDGGIAAFTDISSEVGARVSPPVVEVNPAAEQTFTVTFTHPEFVTADQVFALVVQERSQEGEELLSGFVGLIFPQDVAEALPGSFRIDAFTVAPSSEEGALEAFVQFTNTGSVLVRPASVIILTNRFGTEIGRVAFASHEGRLPVGTTRVVSDLLPSPDFGFWHMGGPVTFTLLSLPAEGGEVQQASIQVPTRMGKGILFSGVLFVFLGACLVIFFFKKRGILRP